MSEGIHLDDLRPRGAEAPPNNDADVGRRPLSRRNFLSGSAALLGGGALMAALPGVALAHDTDDPPSDVDMLNFALTLEHLEATFYQQGLEKFGERQIESINLFDGFGRRVRNRIYANLILIRDHEVEHVDTLSKVIESLGGEPVPPADYNFETTAFTSPRQFIKVAQTLENTGVTAYDGAVAHIESSGTNPQGALLTGGAQIATVEARHASYLNLINRDVPFPDAFDTPVAPQEVFDQASAFISTPLDAPYPPYRSLGAFRRRLPDEVIGGIPAEGL